MCVLKLSILNLKLPNLTHLPSLPLELSLQPAESGSVPPPGPHPSPPGPVWKPGRHVGRAGMALGPHGLYRTAKNQHQKHGWVGVRVYQCVYIFLVVVEDATVVVYGRSGGL